MIESGFEFSSNLYVIYVSIQVHATINSSYCTITSSTRAIGKEKKAKDINRQIWKQNLYCGRKTCGSEIESLKANDICKKIKAEANKHSTEKIVK